MLLETADHPCLVPFEGGLRLADFDTGPPVGAPGKKECRKLLRKRVKELRDLQRRLYADDRMSLLLVFQAMDAAGKDGTIRAVMSGVNPAGCEVYSFKQPSARELDHDFLWRIAQRMPERGRIGVFNRSHYEEVLVVRVHPEWLQAQRLPRGTDDLDGLWTERFRSIREFERHAARAGTRILKFFLHVSRDEQRRRFLSRIEEAEKNWKFSAADVRERRHWEAYQRAYEEALAETSRPWAPWYVVPADSKPWMRLTVAGIVVDSLRALDPRYPDVGDEAREELERAGEALRAEG